MECIAIPSDSTTATPNASHQLYQHKNPYQFSEEIANDTQPIQRSFKSFQRLHTSHILKLGL